MSIREQHWYMELVTSVPTHLSATGILPKTPHKILIIELERKQFKQHSECPVHSTMFTDFSSLKIIIEKIVITLVKRIN